MSRFPSSQSARSNAISSLFAGLLTCLCIASSLTVVTVVAGKTICDAEKASRGFSSCVELSTDIGYYLLYNGMNPANPPANFEFTLLVKNATLVENKWIGMGIGLNGGMKGRRLTS